jgi:hypothetical protein
VSIQDLDYIRKLDSLARFYNSQATAHVGYFLTWIVLYSAVFNIIQPTILEYLHTRFDSLVSLVSVILIFIALLIGWIWTPLPVFSPRYQLARTQYYMELSQIVWEHMAVNNPKAFDRLRKRTEGEYTSIQASVATLFGARLFRSLWKKKHKDEEPPEERKGQRWIDIFDLRQDVFGEELDYQELIKSEVYGMFLPTYHKRWILQIWKLPGYDYADLLWTAHRGTVKTYRKDDQRFPLFDEFLDC